jgi:uncharacterized protein YpmB
METEPTGSLILAFVIYIVVMSAIIWLVSDIVEEEREASDRAIDEFDEEHRKKSEDHSAYYNGMWP